MIILSTYLHKKVIFRVSFQTRTKQAENCIPSVSLRTAVPCQRWGSLLSQLYCTRTDTRTQSGLSCCQWRSETPTATMGLKPWRKPLFAPHSPLQITLARLKKNTHQTALLGSDGDGKDCKLRPKLSTSGSGRAVKVIVQCSHLQLSSAWPELFCGHPTGTSTLLSLTSNHLQYFKLLPTPPHLPPSLLPPRLLQRTPKCR